MVCPSLCSIILLSISMSDSQIQAHTVWKVILRVVEYPLTHSQICSVNRDLSGPSNGVWKRHDYSKAVEKEKRRQIYTNRNQRYEPEDILHVIDTHL